MTPDVPRADRSALLEAAAVRAVVPDASDPAVAASLRTLVDLSGIRPLRVVVDAGDGVAGRTAPAVLGTAAGLPALPLEVVLVGVAPGGTPEARAADLLDVDSLRDLGAAVVAHGADLGLAFDAGRCVVLDERGDAVSPSAITALVGLREVTRELRVGRTPTVVHDLLTSRAVPDLLGAAGARTVRTPVGRTALEAAMAEHDAVFGGEHDGRYHVRDLVPAGVLTAMHVLAALGGQRHPLSVLAEVYQPYVTSGQLSSRVSDVAAAWARVVDAYVDKQGAGPVSVDELDGLTVAHWDAHPQWWFNLRASSTEPLLRLTVEAADDDMMVKVRDDVLALVRSDEEI